MADIVSPENRSRMMARIRDRNTKPELVLRKGLHAAGFRYRLHVKKLPGKPDILFPRHRAALFVHGCFWHGHNCHLFRWPRTREGFWMAKITGNKSRDLRSVDALLFDGWRVGIVWECSLKGRMRLPIATVFDRCAIWLQSDLPCLEIRGTS